MSRVQVTEFTDPYCTWCWGTEPIRRRLQEVYREQIEFEYVMGGLAESFEQFSDPASDVATDGEVATHWQAASQQHGMPVDVSVWRTNPPESTYPACVAYEAAAFQDRELAHAFLRRMREAGAAEGVNLEDEDALAELAVETGLHAGQFRSQFGGDAAREAFREDQQAARRHGATSFPTFSVEFDGERELLRGYRPFPTFEKLFTEADAGLDRHEPRPVPELLDHYGRMATQEVAEIRELSRDDARAALQSLAADGTVRHVDAGNDCFWEPA